MSLRTELVLLYAGMQPPPLPDHILISSQQSELLWTTMEFGKPIAGTKFSAVSCLHFLRGNQIVAKTRKHLQSLPYKYSLSTLLAHLMFSGGKKRFVQCCQKLLVHVWRSKIIRLLIWQETLCCPHVVVIIFFWAKRINIYNLSSCSEMGPERSKQAFQAEHLGEYFHSLRLHHSCGQRLHHSIRHSAAHSNLLITPSSAS